MSDFRLHDQNDAPEDSRPLLEGVQGAFGFTPNLTRILAASPAALEGYLSLDQVLGRSSLSPGEQQVAILTVSFENECDYCMAAHSTIAGSVGLPRDVVDALRGGQPLPDAKLDALRRTTSTLVRDRGHLRDEDVRDFLDAGYERHQLLEVILVVAMKTLSNYVNHVAETPLDEVFASEAWEAPGAALGSD